MQKKKKKKKKTRKLMMVCKYFCFYNRLQGKFKINNNVNIEINSTCYIMEEMNLETVMTRFSNWMNRQLIRFPLRLCVSVSVFVCSLSGAHIFFSSRVWTAHCQCTAHHWFTDLDLTCLFTFYLLFSFWFVIKMVSLAEGLVWMARKAENKPSQNSANDDSNKNKMK